MRTDKQEFEIQKREWRRADMKAQLSDATHSCAFCEHYSYFADGNPMCRHNGRPTKRHNYCTHWVLCKKKAER